MAERKSIQITLPPKTSAAEPSDAQAAPTVTVQADGGPVGHDQRGFVAWLACGATLAALGGYLLSQETGAHVVPAAWALTCGLGFVVHALLGRPLTRLLHQLRDESARLRAAMTCPYCRDTLADEAILCDRGGCGAVYHEECWDECRGSYGGCAIYGCGCTSGHAIGRFALRRRLLKLVVAAVLFPPKAVARIRELESQSFRQAWDEAKAHQLAISHDQTRTLIYGGFNAAACVALALSLLAWLNHWLDSFPLDPEQGLVFMLFMLPLFGLPFLFLRMPLLRAFTWGSAQIVVRVFRAELAALGRADEGTVLGRLLAGVGKK